MTKNHRMHGKFQIGGFHVTVTIMDEFDKLFDR